MFHNRARVTRALCLSGGESLGKTVGENLHAHASRMNADRRKSTSVPASPSIRAARAAER